MATNDFTTNKPVTASSQISFPLQNIYITSPYGYRNDPFTAKRKFHNGIDLRANYEPCYAILDGIVERIGNDKRSGNFITLRHAQFKQKQRKVKMRGMNCKWLRMSNIS